MNSREKLRRIIEESDTKLGRYFDLTIQFLVLLSFLSFSIETIPNLSANTYYWLYIIECIIIFIFTLEYIARIWVAQKPIKYIFSF